MTGRLIKAIFACAILVAIGAVGYNIHQYATYHAALERVESRLSAIEAASKAARDRRTEIVLSAARQEGEFVLILGDSLTEASATPPKVCGVPILNAGVGGARASTLLPLLEEIAVNAQRPKLIVIAIGVNNAATAYWDRRAFETSYKELLRKALSMSRVAVATVTPVDFSLEVGKIINAPARDDINRFIIASSEQLGLDIIRLDQLSREEPLTYDGVHLTIGAKEIWLSKVLGEAALALGCSKT